MPKALQKDTPFTVSQEVSGQKKGCSDKDCYSPFSVEFRFYRGYGGR